MPYLLATLALIPFYLLGAFPTGILIARFKGIKLTELGSGNVGATNVARTIGKSAGLVTLIIDILKGYLAVMFANLVTGSFIFAAWAAFAAVAGHCFSIPKKLKGGKGVATALGVFLYLSPIAAIVALIVFLIIFRTTKIVSLASVTAALVVPIVMFLALPIDTILIPITLISLMIVYRHKENLIRLSQGQEQQLELD